MSPCVAQQQPASLASVLPSGTSGLLLFVCLNPSVEKTLLSPVLHRRLCLCDLVKCLQTLYTQNRVVNQEREFVFEREKKEKKALTQRKRKGALRRGKKKPQEKQNSVLCVCFGVSCS